MIPRLHPRFRRLCNLAGQGGIWYQGEANAGLGGLNPSSLLGNKGSSGDAVVTCRESLATKLTKEIVAPLVKMDGNQMMNKKNISTSKRMD